MKGLAITEYEGGGWNHIAGTIAQADMLGDVRRAGPVRGQPVASKRAPMTMHWLGSALSAALTVALRTSEILRFRQASSDISKVALYASTDSTTPGRVVFIAINRTKNSLVTAINGMTLSGTATIYQMTASSASPQNPVHPVLVGTQAASGTSLKITLPALSVTTVNIQ